MHLKSLEIHGFKSFADKTKLEFGPGITCIVGPNGSGKSNVCDALRWVLGEQSIKTLRGTRLEDVIFGGSESRKPLGMAQVTLTFDNSSGLLPLEFNEVTVSRRVYRSGESEFLINKTPCRLKDIQELFNDTGLGKDAFAIIGQGQVDAILSSRPEDRRSLFEEAAGIIRYRNRKIEAARKLESTGADLERLQDILFEIEQNLPLLKTEAEKTRQYQQWSRELEELEISLSCQDLDKLNHERKSTRDKEKQLESLVRDREKSYTLLADELEQVRLMKQQLEEQQRLRQEEIFRVQGELNKTQNEMAITGERIASIQERTKQIRQEQDYNREQMNKLESEYAEKQQEYCRLQEIVAPEQETLTEHERQLLSCQDEMGTCRIKEDKLKESLFDVEQELVKYGNQQLEIRFELKSLEQQTKKLREKGEDSRIRREELRKRLADNTDSIIRLQTELTRCQERQREVNQERQKLEQQLLTLKDQLEQVRQLKEKFLSRLRALEEMKENLEGYQMGVRNLLRNSEIKKRLGILGVVGELLGVPSQYEKAIETALGAAVQNLVTKTDADAQAAIEWLKKEKAGRATFLPLNTLKPRKLAQEFVPLLGEEGVLGLASELVKIVPGQEKVLEYLLGTIVVVRDLSVGRRVARKSGFSLKVVTLDGDILFPGGSLTGGSQKVTGPGLLGRNREISEQKSKSGKLESRLRELQDEIRNLEQKQQSLGTLVQRLNEENSQLEMKIVSLTGEKERLQQELYNQDKIAQGVQWEEEQLLAEQASLRQQRDKVDNARSVAEAKKAELQQELQQNIERIGLLEEKISTLNSLLTEQKVSLASQKEQLKSLENSLAYYNRNRQQVLEQNKRLEQELNQLLQRHDSLVTYLGQLEKQEGQLLAQRQELESQQENLVAHLQEVGSNLESLETRVRQMNKELQESKNKYHQVVMQLTRLDVEWDNGVKRLQEKFQLSWEQAKERQVEFSSRGEAENRVKTLKKKLNSLGLVNPNALEEYLRQEERYQYLKKQQQDLLDAKQGLLKIIGEMEKIMGQRFKKTFEEVQVAFQEIFTYLFDGGKAALQLTEAEDLLTTGVEIIAQPPGKKMQNLSLLSGGERALTATALLFALLKVKPSPFCVLDEIEANLDEVNVDRVAKYLRQMVDQIQFIMVSHRQGTMEAADALYGVTMEESGVSRLVSVKLSPVTEAV